MTKTRGFPSPRHKQILTFSLLLALAGCDKISGKTPLEHIQKAIEFRNQGDFRASSIELKNALQKSPDLMLARQLLGEVDLVLGENASAEKEFRQVIALGGRKNALLGLAESLQVQEKYKETMDEIDVPPNMTPQEQASLRAYRGDALIALGKLQPAKTEYEEGLKADAASPMAKLGLARLAVAFNDPKKAEGLLDEALATAPNEAKIWSFRGDFYRSKGDLAKAQESYTKAIENRRLNIVDHGNLALVFADLGNYKAAAEEAKILREKAPNYFMSHHIDGVIALANKDYAQAQSEFEESLKLNPRYVSTRYYLAYAHLMQGHLGQAELSIKEFLGGLPGSVGGMALMAVIKISLGDYEGARLYATPLLKFQPNNPSFIELMGIIEMAKGDHAAALKLLEKSASLDPKSALSQFGVAMSLMGKGEKEKGLAALEVAAKLDERSENPMTMLVLSEIEGKQFDKARKSLDEMKAKRPDSVMALDLEGVLYTAQGQHEQALERFQTAWAKAPGDSMAGLNLAKLAIDAKRPDDARGYYEQILKAHPKDMDARMKWVQLDAAQGRFAEVEARLNETIQILPDAIQPRLVMARHLNRFGQPERALAVIADFAPKYSGDPYFLETYVPLLVTNHRADSGLLAAKRWVALNPGSVAHYWLARAYAETGDLKNASAELEKTLALDPALVPARILKIQLTAAKNPEQAVPLIEQLRRDQPDSAEVLGLAGGLARQRHRLQDSLQAYQAAFDKEKTSETVANLAQAQWFVDDKAAAVKTLEDWRGQIPQDTAARVLLSGMYQAQGKTPEARTELQAALKTDDSNPVILNELAVLLQESDPHAALNYAEKAFGAAPTNPSIVDTTASLLLDTGSKERALQMLKAIRPQVSENFTIRFHYAVALAETGDRQGAVQELKDILAAGRSFPQQSQADKLLKQLLSKE